MSLQERPFDASLLRTMFVPDEAQSKPISDAIATQKGAIEAIDSQISDLEQRIVDLRKSRQDISDNMAFNEAFLAPIRRVAPEILCKIFGHCLPAEPTHDFPIPLLLMSVCHTWRRIVEETPQLWAQIHVTGSRTRLSLVEMFLRNSVLVPLDVTLLYNDIRENASEFAAPGWGDAPPNEGWVDLPPNEGWDSPWHLVDEDQDTSFVETMEIVRVLSAQHRRIRRLSLQAPYSILTAFFPSRSRMKTSLLEDLSVNCPDTLWIPSHSAPHFQLKGGRLRTLALYGSTFPVFSINRTFGLRRVFLNGSVPLSRFLQFLRVSPALEELVMKNFRPYPIELTEPPNVQDLVEPEPEPVFLDKLSLLEIHWHSCQRHPLFKSLRTPAVTKALFTGSYVNLDDMYTLLSGMARTLVRLSLEGLRCNLYQFFRIVKGLSALEVLHLAEIYIDEIWEVFLPEEDAAPGDWVCPKLTTLEVREVNLEVPFLAFVRSRTKPVQSATIEDGFHYLRSVATSQQYVHPELAASLKTLESERESFSFESRDCRDRRGGYPVNWAETHGPGQP